MAVNWALVSPPICVRDCADRAVGARPRMRRTRFADRHDEDEA